jgi:hypothetical protein
VSGFDVGEDVVASERRSHPSQVTFTNALYSRANVNTMVWATVVQNHTSTIYISSIVPTIL